jgi:hypothetical protein
MLERNVEQGQEVLYRSRRCIPAFGDQLIDLKQESGLPLAHSRHVGLPTPGCIYRDGELVMFVFELSPFCVQQRDGARGLSHNHPWLQLGCSRAFAALARDITSQSSEEQNVGAAIAGVPAGSPAPLARGFAGGDLTFRAWLSLCQGIASVERGTRKGDAGEINT